MIARAATFCLVALVAVGARMDQLRVAHVRIKEKIEESEQGRFDWGYDVGGNKFELWEPPKGA
jgi:hypothetical protein